MMGLVIQCLPLSYSNSPQSLYSKDGNATDQFGHSAHQLRPDYITLNMLSTEVLGLLDVTARRGNSRVVCWRCPRMSNLLRLHPLRKLRRQRFSGLEGESTGQRCSICLRWGRSLGGKIYFVGGAYPPSNLRKI